MYGLDSPGTGQGQVVGSCKYSNGHKGSIKSWKFLEQLRNSQLLADSALCSSYVSIINVTVVYLCRLGRYEHIPPKPDAMVLNSTCFMLLLAPLCIMQSDRNRPRLNACHNNENKLQTVADVTGMNISNGGTIYR